MIYDKRILSISVLVFAACLTVLSATSVSAVRKSAAYLDNNLYPAGSAREAVVAMEDRCSQELQNNITNRNGRSDREVVNDFAYVDNQWLSRANNPNRSQSNSVPFGTTSLQLQINQMMFVCAIITAPPRDPVPGSVRINPDTLVTPVRYPNDGERAGVSADPIADTSPFTTNRASRYESNSRIYSINPDSGGSISGGVGAILGYNRENDSRYWFAPVVPFTYNLPAANQTPGVHTIRVTVGYAKIATYHDFGNAGESRCEYRTDGITRNVTYNDFNTCEIRNVTYDFTYTVLPAPEFTPTVTASRDVVTIGEQFSFTFRVQNNSTYAAGTTYTATVNGQSGPPNVTRTGSTNNLAPGQTQTLNIPGSQNITASSAMGSRVCARLTIPTKPTVTACVTIGKRPLFQSYNGDIWAGGSFGNGTCSPNASSPGNIQGTVSTATAGSWAEYGAFALGEIENFGTATQPLFGAAGRKLTFANGAELGYFNGNPAPAGSSHCLTDLGAMYGDNLTATAATTLSIDSIPGTGRVSTGDVTINGGQVTAGKRIVIVSSGTVTIAGNINYQDTGYTDPSQLPQVVIVADNIVVRANVTRVDAWLNAYQTLSTCDQNGSLTINICNQQITFNGPVITKQVRLLRTFGAEQSNRNTPAEIFNLRPDALLQAYAERPGAANVRTIYQAELPPRY